MAFDTLTLNPASPHLGAEVRHIDITRPLTIRADAARFAELLRRYGVHSE